MRWLVLIVILYSVAFSFLSIRNHELYQTFGWDLGFFDQLLWQASRGNWNFVSSIGDINLVGDHFQPILYLLVPLYWIWDDIRVILIVQTIIVASAAIPLYLLGKEEIGSRANEHVLSFRVKSRNLGAKRRLVSLRWIPRLSAFARDDGSKNFTQQFPRSNRLLPLLISIGYLLFHGTQFTLTNEFHQSAFIPLFLSLGLYFLETGKTKQGIASLLLLLLVREETALLIAGVGLMYLARRRAKLGISLVIIGITSFFLLVSWVIPHISSQGKYIHFGYGELGSTPIEVASTSFQDPVRALKLLASPQEKLVQIRNALLAFGGLPLLSPSTLIPVAIHYSVRFVDTRNIHRWFDTNHYAAPLGVLLAFATTQGFSVIPRLTRNLYRYRFPIRSGMTWVVFAFGIIGTNLLVHAPIFAFTKSQLYFTPQWVRDANNLVASVPRDAAVAANNSLFPHLSHRDKIYLLPETRDAEYIAVDLSDGPNKYAPWGYEKMREFVDGLMDSGFWVIEKQIGQVVLLKRYANN